ncbi:nuclease-related domain-containing protein [Patulibacter defluvii]|uniref:nuclease-related domain-containing protein n=1 Tax=Patulibacter defluvii TaxID=3095358 RepID=UPI002A74D51A|nr:nuclease-related domain-containing protein [Patulibacter sp. DM4]
MAILGGLWLLRDDGAQSGGRTTPASRGGTALRIEVARTGDAATVRVRGRVGAPAGRRTTVRLLGLTDVAGDCPTPRVLPSTQLRLPAGTERLGWRGGSRRPGTRLPGGRAFAVRGRVGVGNQATTVCAYLVRGGAAPAVLDVARATVPDPLGLTPLSVRARPLLEWVPAVLRALLGVLIAIALARVAQLAWRRRQRRRVVERLVTAGVGRAGPSPSVTTDGAGAGASAARAAERIEAAAVRRAAAGDLVASEHAHAAARQWRRGAEGEAWAAVAFETLRRGRFPHVAVLHDRGIPGRRANLDHLLIGPGGVVVADSKNYVGRARVRDGELWVGGRRRPKLAAGVHRQTEQVRLALARAGLGQVPVHGVLHWVAADELPPERAVVDGVPLLEAEDCLLLAAAGGVEAAVVARAVTAIERAFPVA